MEELPPVVGRAGLERPSELSRAGKALPILYRVAFLGGSAGGTDSRQLGRVGAGNCVVPGQAAFRHSWMSPWHRVALVTDGPVFALVKGHDRVSGTHRVGLQLASTGSRGPR